MESDYELPTLIEQATAWTGKEIKPPTEAMAEEAYHRVCEPILERGWRTLS